MNDEQQKAHAAVMRKFNVLGTDTLPDGRVQEQVSNGPTPYLFINKNGVIEDEDGYAVAWD